MNTAQQSHEALWKEFYDASLALHRCDCGSKVVLQYQPGLTSVACIGERKVKFSLPDWQPNETKDQWNQTHPCT